MRIETHICTSVQLCSLDCVRVRDEGSRSSGCEGGLSRGEKRKAANRNWGVRGT